MFAPKEIVDLIVKDINSNTITSLEEIEGRWKSIHKAYYDMEWTWVVDQMKYWYGKDICDLTLNDIHNIIDRWIKSVTCLDNMLLEDAKKEYSMKSRTGFGIDNPIEEAIDDFTNVRGNFDEDPFVAMVREHIASKCDLAQKTKSIVYIG